MSFDPFTESREPWFPPMARKESEIVSFSEMLVERDLWSAMQAVYQLHGQEAGRAKIAEMILELEAGRRQ